MSRFLATRSLHIFLLAMSVLILEVAFTRIFSFITFHHLTYLVISVAMLGFGGAGTYLVIRKKESDEHAERFLARNAALMGLTAMVAVVWIPRIRFYPMDIVRHGDYSNLFSLLFILIISTAPFFFGGAAIVHIISKSGSAVNRVYFADLIGAASGCLLSLALINYLGGIGACFVSAAVAILVAALCRTPARSFYLIGFLITALATPVCANPLVLPLYASPGKQMFRLEPLIEKVTWHVIARLDVGVPFDCYCSFGGGISPVYKGPRVSARIIYQDASNLTGIIHPTPTPRETPALGYYMQGAPYQVRKKADALVIGSGGGIDVLIALFHRARHVVAVDVNPKMMDLVTKEYRDHAGWVFQRPDVEPVVSEGRHFLSRERRTFDVIQLSGVDTWAAQSAGAFALTESFIYTAEAFDEYLAHLKPNGIVNFSRPYARPPLETMKLATTAMGALERVGAEEPHRHLFVMGGLGQETHGMIWAQTLVKRSPFTPEESERLATWTESLGFKVYYHPYKPKKRDALDGLVRASSEDRAWIIEHFLFDIAPATDDRPFYFQQHRWRDLFDMNPSVHKPMAMVVLISGFIQAALLSALLILVPLYRRGQTLKNRGGRASVFLLFASLGFGFIMVEMALLQKLTIFLGSPAHSMSITLFTLLLSSGLGSFLSRNMSRRPLRLLAIVVPLLTAAVVVDAFFINQMITHLMALTLVQRAIVVVLLVAPLGLLMGMPFPAGLRYVDEIRPELNPWAWGINACATVVGTYLCMFISNLFGFNTALFLGAFIYLAGWLLFTGTRYLARENRTGQLG